MVYQVTKKPWLGATLTFLLGPFGFLYYSWKKALIAFLLFVLPNMLLYNLDSTVAEIVRWGVQLLMAAFVYLDLSGRLYMLDDIISGIFSTISVPIMLLNVFGGIISGIWLIALGQWKLVVGAFFFTMLVPWAYSLVAILQMPLAALLMYAQERNKKKLCLTLGFINIFISHLIILIYVFFIVGIAVDISIYRNLNTYVLLLLGYGVATSPFSYMASKEGPDSLASMLGVFVAQMSYLIFAIAYIFKYAAISIPIILLIVFSIELFQLHVVSEIMPDEDELQIEYDY